MSNELKQWQKTAVSIILVWFIPLYSLVRLIGRLFYKNFLTFDKEIKQPMLKYVVDDWLSEKVKAQNKRVFILFLLPSLLAFLVFVITPFLQGLYLSMTDWNGLNNGREKFTRFDNYSTMFSDVHFYYSFVRTITYAFLNVIAINLVAFGLALLVVQNTKLKNFYRAGFFMPNLIGGLVLGYIWQFIYNRALTTFGGIFATSFIVNSDTAMFALIGVVTWQYAGYIMMIYVAALQNVPQDLIEASKIDGATAFQRLKVITLPLIQQAFTVASFLTLVTAFKQFDTVLSLTQGGPFTALPVWLANLVGANPNQSVSSLNFIAINIYNTAFKQNMLGVGQAKAIVFFVFLLLVSMIQVYFNKRKEVEM